MISCAANAHVSTAWHPGAGGSQGGLLRPPETLPGLEAGPVPEFAHHGPRPPRVRSGATARLGVATWWLSPRSVAGVGSGRLAAGCGPASSFHRRGGVGTGGARPHSGHDFVVVVAFPTLESGVMILTPGLPPAALRSTCPQWVPDHSRGDCIAGAGPTVQLERKSGRGGPSCPPFCPLPLCPRPYKDSATAGQSSRSSADSRAPSASLASHPRLVLCSPQAFCPDSAGGGQGGERWRRDGDSGEAPKTRRAEERRRRRGAERGPRL